VTVDVTNEPLFDVLQTIARQAGLKLMFNERQLQPAKRVTLRLHAVSARDAFAQALSGTGLKANIVDRIAVLSDLDDGSAQPQGTIHGRVIDGKTQQPLQGAMVFLDGATKGVSTDDDGDFRFGSVASGTHTVRARRLGYGRAAKTVSVADSGTVSLQLVLNPSVNALEQVVVTGTVIPTELRAVPNAITVITAKELQDRGITHIDQLFRGDVPGVFAWNSGSQNTALSNQNTAGSVVMFSRGATAIKYGFSAGTVFGTNPIKTYVDGVELSDPGYLNQIDPQSIERIEILTGPQASTLYGSNALNGVMQVFTKRGASSHPQLTLSLVNGWSENNFTSALTPQHDYSAQVNGVEGRMSYNGGGSWVYIGPWSPASQSGTLSGFGGVHLTLPTKFGTVTTDGTARRTSTQNLVRGSAFQQDFAFRQTGIYEYNWQLGLPTRDLLGIHEQTMGVTLNYSPFAWWSHEFVLGQDGSDVDQGHYNRGYGVPADTTQSIQGSHTERRSLRYATTAQVPLTSYLHGTVTGGADGWQSLATSFNGLPIPGGTLTNVYATRLASHNTGAFVQAQLGIFEQFYLTYGIRAEWNPNFGAEVTPNYSPRYGAVYTRDLGVLTLKLRGSYGRSTRPPATGQINSVPQTDPTSLSVYGPYNRNLANPDLLPEHQQGGEGGLELYLGNHASLVLTRYNQTVDNLISGIKVDSVQRLDKDPDPYSNCATKPITCYYGAYAGQYQYINLASIRNQGWEGQGSVTIGPLTTKGTYSFTKSRVLGTTPKYQSLFSQSPEYQRGTMYNLLPEHTWTLGFTYGTSASTVVLNINGIGEIMNDANAFSIRYLNSTRLSNDTWHMNNPPYVNFNSSYVTADLNVSRHLSGLVDGLLQVQNLTNHYVNDLSASYATIGRQTQLGFRLRL